MITVRTRAAHFFFFSLFFFFLSQFIISADKYIKLCSLSNRFSFVKFFCSVLFLLSCFTLRYHQLFCARKISIGTVRVFKTFSKSQSERKNNLRKCYRSFLSRRLEKTKSLSDVLNFVCITTIVDNNFFFCRCRSLFA